MRLWPPAEKTDGGRVPRAICWQERGSALPRREHEAGWEGLRGSPRCSPSGRAPPGPPGRAPANKLGREPREGKGPGRWRAMTLALKRLLGFCGFFPSPQRFLAFHLSCCSGASLLVPTAGERAGVAGPPASGRGVWLPAPCCVGPGPTARRVSPLLRLVSCAGGTRFRSSQVVPQWEIHPAQLLPFFKKWPAYVGLCSYKQKEQETFQTKSPSVSETTSLNFHVSEKTLLSSVAEWSFPVILWWSA